MILKLTFIKLLSMSLNFITSKILSNAVKSLIVKSYFSVDLFSSILFLIFETSVDVLKLMKSISFSSIYVCKLVSSCEIVLMPVE